MSGCFCSGCINSLGGFENHSLSEINWGRTIVSEQLSVGNRNFADVAPVKVHSSALKLDGSFLNGAMEVEKKKNLLIVIGSCNT